MYPSVPLRISICFVATLAALAAVAAGEVPVGKPLPALRARGPGDAEASLERRDGSLAFATGGATRQPRATVLHFFQPDCLACEAQLRALQELHVKEEPRAVLVVALGYRGSATAAFELAKKLGLGFPVLHAPDAAEPGAGDALAIVDGSGTVRYAQVGYGEGDEELWREAVERLLSGRPVERTTTSRERLKAGDRFPAIELSSVRTGKPMALVGEDSRLVFRDDQGKRESPRAALFFFSRY